MRPLASTGWVEIVAGSLTGQPASGLRFFAAAVVMPASVAYPLPPLSCRYLGQAPSAAELGTTLNSKAAAATEASRPPAQTLAPIDAIGVEVSGGVTLVDAAVGDGGGAEDHGRLRIGDGAFEENRAVGAGHHGGERPVADHHHAGGCRHRAQDGTRGADFPERSREVVGIVREKAAGNGSAIRFGAAAGDVERMPIKGAGGDAAVALGGVRARRVRQGDGGDRTRCDVRSVEDIVVAVLVRNAEQLSALPTRRDGAGEQRRRRAEVVIPLVGCRNFPRVR